MAEDVIYTSLSLPQTQELLPPAAEQPPGVKKPSSFWSFAAVALGTGVLVNILITIGLGTHVFSKLERFSTKENIQNLKGQLQESQKLLKRTNSFLQELETLLTGQLPVCTIGWLQNGEKCYYFSVNKKTWDESRKQCHSWDSDLLLIKDNITLSFIQEHSNGTAYFIGLRRESRSRPEIWRWTDGTVLDKLFQVQRTSDLSCVRVASGELRQESCSKDSQWVCEKKAHRLQLLGSSLSPARSLLGADSPPSTGPE
ncbi:killer cell lectin-like receptor subfamily B member 1B allele C [Rhinatrema bivittatum]|uniref:killer cell lectin-like receptor subfamily B member 1B allele C n=1 Tax=Rhinatrema bivittatum TaxID=194408 RepID=UPI0011267B56|nr:killer cell lectin-like receptor subfamily B member 1B allele C [Rhinatrema bivittatum]